MQYKLQSNTETFNNFIYKVFQVICNYNLIQIKGGFVFAITRFELLDIELDKITTAAALVVTAFYILNSTVKKNEELCKYLSILCEKSTDSIFMISTVLMSKINSI